MFTKLIAKSVHDVSKSSHYAVHLKLIQCCMSIVSQQNRKKKKRPKKRTKNTNRNGVSAGQ